MQTGCSDLGEVSPTWTETARTIQVCSRNDLLTPADPHADSSINWSSFAYIHFRSHLLKLFLKICYQIWRHVPRWEEALPSLHTPQASVLGRPGCSSSVVLPDGGLQLHLLARTKVGGDRERTPCKWLSPNFLSFLQASGRRTGEWQFIGDQPKEVRFEKISATCPDLFVSQ